MGEKVIIVESPSKSKTISSYFKNEVKVLSSVGHIRDLQTSGPQGLGVDIENNFAPDYGIIKGKNSLVNDLIKATKGKEVLIATDPDREGEAIAWHLAQVLKLNLDDDNRIIFREITKPAILEAVKHPRKIDLNLVDSQETRRVLDRIIGFKLSGLLRRKNSGNPTAGRVQSVALKLVVDLEREIQAFIPEEYHNIFAYFKDFKAEYIIKKNHKIKADEAKQIVLESTNPFVVKDITKKEQKKHPKPPFITSTLQQDGVNSLYMSSAKVMSVAQRLYEGIAIENETVGLITYMRTDSNRLSQEFVREAQNHIKANYGEKYLGFYKDNTNAAAQDAHEAIRPTSLSRTPQMMEKFLDKDEYKLYKRIYERALASLMSPALYESSKMTFEAGKKHLYQVDGSIIIFDGYQKVFDDTAKDKLLPKLNIDDKLDATKVEAEQKFTQPPARYNEASLIKELESKGIGRPSTYSSIVNILKDKKRNYVIVENKRFVPTEQGIMISDQLDKFFNSIINTEYTSNLENKLDKISEGNDKGLDILSDFYRGFIPLLEKADQGLEKPAAEVTDHLCPLCGSPLVVRKSRYGAFLGCSKFPKCRHTEEFK